MGFNVNVQVQMSKELKVMGAIGHLNSLKKASPAVSPRTIGESGTAVWKICGIDPLSTFGFYFSVVNQDQPPKRNQKGLIQFTTSYMDSSGAHILRVTTPWAPIRNFWGSRSTRGTNDRFRKSKEYSERWI